MIVSPGSLTVTENQTATFYCSAAGNPKPSVSWSKQSGAKLMNTENQHKTLEIKNTTYSDAGKYLCIAENVLGKIQKEVELFVQGIIFVLSN